MEMAAAVFSFQHSVEGFVLGGSGYLGNRRKMTFDWLFWKSWDSGHFE